MKENLLNLIEKFKLPLVLGLAGVVLIIGGLLMGSSNPKEFPKESLVETSSLKQVTVYVSGAVLSPGVYKLKEGSRIEDAVLAAGGFSADAQAEFISKVLNLAQKLADGSKVYIPKTGETASAVAGTTSATKININSASASELESLPDIAKTRAQNIISGRPYQSIEELVSKKVIPKTVFDKIKDQIVVY